jgi:multicomponent Na+:H+ antiporter subunit B
MNRTARLVVFGLGAAVIAVIFVAASTHMTPFGSNFHPYRDHAVAAAVAHATANAVSSVNFDQRALDTLIEESILVGSVLAAVTLLRLEPDEEERRVPDVGHILPSTKLTGYVMLPLTIVIGIDLVVHGHLTPGGGFQGGVVIATGIHLLYIAGSFQAVEGIRPLAPYRMVEAVAGASFACLGIATALAGAGFLADVLGRGRFADLFSGGTVPMLNGIVGVAVAAGLVVLFASFLDQEIAVRKERDTDTGSGSGADSGATSEQPT